MPQLHLYVAVIDDALCEQRLWDMKHRGEKNFYMCEIRKDFTIDATFKGNSSRFLNHGCDPNCFLEKWLVSPSSANEIINSYPSVIWMIVKIYWNKRS